VLLKEKAASTLILTVLAKAYPESILILAVFAKLNAWLAKEITSTPPS